jgi:hypothetical protein
VTVHTLRGLMDVLANYSALTDQERSAAVILGAGVERALPKGRVWPVLTEDADPALWELEAIASDVSEMQDTLALVEDRLTELKRLRRAGGS